MDVKNKIRELQKYIAGFKEEQRDILIMRLWQEMSYAEIAVALGKSEASCKMSFSRSINKLRQEMPLSAFVGLLLLNL